MNIHLQIHILDSFLSVCPLSQLLLLFHQICQKILVTIYLKIDDESNCTLGLNWRSIKNAYHRHHFYNTHILDVIEFRESTRVQERPSNIE